MKSYHHFSFSRGSPGVVTLKEFSDSAATTFRILGDDSWTPITSQLPPQILPPGLSCERQWYLYREIRRYGGPGTEDSVCPFSSATWSTGAGRDIEERPVERDKTTTHQAHEVLWALR